MIRKIVKEILENDQVKHANDYLLNDDANTLKEQLELVQIPSPSFEEAVKCQVIEKKLKEYGLTDIVVDNVGNLIATRPGTKDRPNIVISTHMDTVFEKDTDLTVTKDGDVYRAPSICDATRSIAEMLSIVRAMNHSDIKTVGNLIFCFTVGEEAKGDLYGSRNFFKMRDDIDAFVTVDTGMAHGIIFRAQGGSSYQVKVEGAGGHGFIDFGTPSANHALGRAMAKVADMQMDKESNTTFNIGIISGGNQSSAISKEAMMTLNLRSDNDQSLKEAEEEAIRLIHQGIQEENDRWSSDKKVKVTINLLSSRPSGHQPSDAPIVKIASEATDLAGLEVILATPAATDANIPISKGIPAICVGHGGLGGGIHSTDEWFSPVESYLGPQRAMLIVLAMTGIVDCSEPIKL